MKNPKQEEFELNSVKFKDGVLAFKAVLTLSDGNDMYKPTLDDKIPLTPHPDLTDQFLRLKKPLAKLHGFLDLQTIVEKPEFEATAAQIEAAEKHTELKMSDITVTGISVSGQDKKRGVVITGVYDGQAINRKRLLFVGTKYGFEEELEEIVDTISEETYKFIYEDKKAQQDVFESDPIDGTGEDFEKETQV